MSRLITLGMAATLLLAGMARGASRETMDCYKQVLIAMKEEVRMDADKPNGGEAKRRLMNDLQDYFTQPSSFDRSLDRVDTTFVSPVLMEETGRLRDLLKRDRNEENQAAIKEVSDRIQRIREALLAAKVPADLDSISQELTAVPVYSGYEGASEEVRALRNQLNSMRSFVASWQDYLDGRARGNRQAQLLVLKQLVALDPGALPIPRSVLLDRQKELQIGGDEFIKRVSEITSLDQIQGALAALQGVPDGDPQRQAQQGLIQALSDIDSRYRQFLSGLPVSLEFYESGQGADAGNEKVAELKSMLVKRLLPRSLGAPETLQPREDESALAYIDRVGQDARERGDLGMALKARQAKGTLNPNGRPSTADTAAVAAWLAAGNQERAGQYLLAVISYQQVLKSGSDLPSPTLIGSRLEAIHKEHPAEYQQGIDWFLKSMLPAAPANDLNR